MKTQTQMFYEESRKISESYQLFNDFVKDSMTKQELERLIAKRPSTWSKFSAWLDKLPNENDDIPLTHTSGYTDY